MTSFNEINYEIKFLVETKLIYTFAASLAKINTSQMVLKESYSQIAGKKLK